MSVRSLIEGSGKGSTIPVQTVTAPTVNAGTLSCTTLTSGVTFINTTKPVAFTKGHYTVSQNGTFPFSVSDTGNGSISSTSVRGTTIVDDPVAMVAGLAGGIGIAASTRESKMNFDPNFSTAPLSQLKYYKFQYRQKDKDGKYLDIPVQGERYGLIYDEVEKVCPNLCVKDIDGKPITVNYDGLICQYGKKIQEMDAYIKEMASTILVLKAKLGL